MVVWDVTNGQRVFEVGDELDEVLAADISSDQTLIALGGPERVVRIYSTETGQLVHELRKHTDWICSLEFSPTACSWPAVIGMVDSWYGKPGRGEIT